MIRWLFFSSYYDLIILISFTGMPRLQAPALLLKGIHLTGRSLGKTPAKKKTSQWYLPKWVGFKPSPNGRFWIGLPHYVFPNLEWTNFWIELFCHDLCEVMWSMSPFLARSPSDYDHKSFHDHSEFISYDVTWTCWKMSDANQKDSIQCSSLKWPPLRIHWMNSPNLEPRTHTDPNSDLASEFGKVELPNSPYGKPTSGSII